MDSILACKLLIKEKSEQVVIGSDLFIGNLHIFAGFPLVFDLRGVVGHCQNIAINIDPGKPAAEVSQK